MSICYNETTRTFKLDTLDSSYVMGVPDSSGHLIHYYWGKRLMTDRAAYLARTDESPFTPDTNERDKVGFMDTAPFEYPAGGAGDFRERCLDISDSSGRNGLELSYVSHLIVPGKPALPGLPSVAGAPGDCSTLSVIMADAVAGIEVTLNYSVFEKLNVITRSAVITNKSGGSVYLNRALSMCLDVENTDYSFVSLHGAWARERQIQTLPIGIGRQCTSSERGEPGHQNNPFAAIVSEGTDQTHGTVFGINLVYSGNFLISCEMSQNNRIRAVAGINPETFRWQLKDGESFVTPEAVTVFSAEGLGKMTRTFHDLYRNHLIRDPYRYMAKPVLINNWEATYFDFNLEKLLSIAGEASGLGIDMLVMDDGWFGNRFDDNRALGDWFVNENKLPGGLKALSDGVNNCGMKLGIWIEPEMVSPDSDLYRAHPDWAIEIPGRRGSLSRAQLVLDITRQDVREYIKERLYSVLSSANIEYVKWDMNRPVSDAGSISLPAERQGEFSHRYVLALYELQGWLIDTFPHLLLENCSGGGARFDPGMLYFSPQIWCSDNTDAIDRLSIQEGTAIAYPPSCIGAHVSDSPNHITGRSTPFETRGIVAMAGTFGYELDITAISQSDRNMVKSQTERFAIINGLVREGDYYRLASYRENHDHDSWMFCSKDGKTAVLTLVQVVNRTNSFASRINLQGLDPAAEYEIEGFEETFPGDVLMYGGLSVKVPAGDFRAVQLLIRRV